MSEKKRTGIVFGVFDGLHPGHTYLLAEALKMCEKLIVVLTLPETAMLLKGHGPKLSYADRAKAIENFSPNIRVIPSDMIPGTWSVLKDPKFDPSSSLVILGYDQSRIAEELKNMKIPFATLPPHHPEKYKSSLL